MVTDIEEMVSQVNRYFIDKILAGDFEVISKDSYCVTIAIDDKYIFSFWMANGESYLKVDNTMKGSFFLVKFSEIERWKAYRILNEKSGYR